jgi:hypothetical protein
VFRPISVSSQLCVFVLNFCKVNLRLNDSSSISVELGMEMNPMQDSNSVADILSILDSS